VEAAASRWCLSVIHQRQKNKDTSDSQPKKAEMFQQIGKLQMELEWLKNISAVLTPVKCASWSITTIQISASAGNAPCWLCSDRCSITGRDRCWNRPCSTSRWMVDYLARKGIPIRLDRV